MITNYNCRTKRMSQLRPGDGDLPARVAGLQRGLQLDPLLVGQRVRAAAEQPSHLEQRNVSAPRRSSRRTSNSGSSLCPRWPS